MLIDVIAGARPNFMKVAALFRVADQFPDLTLRLVHTGQHYDYNMSDVFFQDLGLPEPNCHLEVGSNTHAIQTAEIMKGYEGWLDKGQPDYCVVVGDVNSTLACAITATKRGIPVAHVEAGLRSFDRSMPEEINRIVTDSISNLLFVTEPSGLMNLAREGHSAAAVHLVGHVMIDTLFHLKNRAEQMAFHQQLGLSTHEYAYLTLHRPSNVDISEQLERICDEIVWLADQINIIFPVHPRTKGKLAQNGLYSILENHPQIHLLDPLSYIESISLLLSAKMVITDSGGIQEESAALGIPCLTLRENTERPITIEMGQNTLIANNWGLFRHKVIELMQTASPSSPSPIPYWDGKAGLRIMSILAQRA